MKRTLFLFTLLVAAKLCFAQHDFPIAQPQFILLMQPKVQEHLKLSDEQKKKVKSVIEGVAEDDGNGRTMIRITGDTDMEQLDKDVVAVLDKDQTKRFSELYAQRSGYVALSRKEYAEKLSLTDEQKKTLEKAWDNHRERMEQHFTENAPGSRELKVEKEDMKKLNDALNKEVEAVLTKEQIEKWKGLQGEKFDFGDKN